MKKPSQRLTIVLSCILGILLILKLSTSLVRQFDPDEMSYLHWAYLLYRGNLPFRDFFFFIAPLYPWFLSVLFFLHHSAGIALYGRMLMFIVYLIMLGILYWFVKKATKNIYTSLLALIIFTAFPMTFDKTIELRPDMLMTVLFFLGTMFLCDTHWGEIRANRNILLSGFFLSLSFLVMFKIVFAAPAVLYLLFTYRKTVLPTLGLFLCGALIPIGLFCIYLIATGLVGQFYWSVTYGATIANVGNSAFPFWKTLYPWPLIYVQHEGVSLPWIINSILFLLMIPGLFFLIKQNRKMGIFLLLLFLGSAGLIVAFPKPYVQYFIFPSIIASIGSAVCLTKIFSKKYLWGIAGCALVCLISFSIQTMDRKTPLGSNQEQLDVLENVLSVIKPDEPVYDMVGSYVFRPDGYYICCHAYIQFAHLLKKVMPTLPTLSESLVQTKTKFLVMDQKAYVFWVTKPEDIAFMTTHYLASAYKKIYTVGARYQCTNRSCVQEDAEGKIVSPSGSPAVDIIIDEQYKVTIEPDNQWIQIRGNTYHNGDVVSLSPSAYPFTVSPLVRTWSLQLSR